MSGYHIKEMPKGVYGEFSKIEEEMAELLDAHDQINPIMELCEISDLLGAIEEYIKKYNMNLGHIISMRCATERAFENGDRK